MWWEEEQRQAENASSGTRGGGAGREWGTRGGASMQIDETAPAKGGCRGKGESGRGVKVVGWEEK